MSAKRAKYVLIVSLLYIPAPVRADGRDASRKQAQPIARSVEADPSYQRLVDHVTRMGLLDRVIETDAADPSASGDDPCAPTPNGCGPSGFLGFFANCPFNFVCFEPACNQHDICYGTCGAPRLTCDYYFFTLMWGICQGTFPPDSQELQTCGTLAFIYYALVYYFGEEAYNGSQASACSCDPGAPAFSPDVDVPRRLAMEPPFVDDDRDLLPDDWERTVGLSRRDIDSFDDSDGDGLINLAEFIHGTDPFNVDTDGNGIDDAGEVTGDERVRLQSATRR